MGLNKGVSLMRLTASCEVTVRNVGRARGCVVLEITQGTTTGEEVTTLLLRPERARELASVLLRHSGHAPADGDATGIERGRREEGRAS